MKGPELAEGDMRGGDFVGEYRRLNAEDQSACRKWLIVNAVFGVAAILSLVVFTAIYSGGGTGSMTADKQQQVTTARSMPQGAK
jgi:hypothetical protein